MAHISNSTVVDAVKEITVAALAGKDSALSAESGRHVAEFMQAIYDKLNEFAQAGV